MKAPLNSALTYAARVFLKTLLLSSLLAAIALRAYTHYAIGAKTADDDLPMALLCIVLFGWQLICALIPALLFSGWVNIVTRKPSSQSKQKWAIWRGAVSIAVIFLLAFITVADRPQPLSATLISGVDDLLTFCICGVVIGLSYFIWREPINTFPASKDSCTETNFNSSL